MAPIVCREPDHFHFILWLTGSSVLTSLQSNEPYLHLLFPAASTAADNCSHLTMTSKMVSAKVSQLNSEWLARHPLQPDHPLRDLVPTSAIIEISLALPIIIIVLVIHGLPLAVTGSL